MISWTVCKIGINIALEVIVISDRVSFYMRNFSVQEYFKEFKLDHESECNDFLLHRLIFKLSLLLCCISTDLDYLIIIQNGQKDMSLMNLQYFRG